MATLSVSDDGVLVVETFRSGHFKFQIGLNFNELNHLRILVDQAYARFNSMPRIGDMVNQLEKIALVTSIYSTNTIEGGDLTKEETEDILTLSPDQATTKAQKRVVNLGAAYRIAEDYPKRLMSDLGEKEKQAAEVQGALSLNIVEQMVTDLHKLITEGLEHSDNISGQYRDNPKGRKTQIGDKNHGGTYTPPKCLDDIKLLIAALVAWANSKPIRALPPLYRCLWSIIILKEYIHSGMEMDVQGEC